MYLPQIIVQPLQPRFNVRLICRYLAPSKAANKTRPFAEKTYAMYPELLDTLEGKDEGERNEIIRQAVEKRLADSAEEIAARVEYFQTKFDSFLYDSIEAQCRLYNYSWKESHQYINCYVGYIPFYPRNDIDKWFYISYNDEERAFSGAVHEINHMIFYEKWKEMNDLDSMPGPRFPEPIWFLQEMVVDPTLNDPTVKPHTMYENRAYDQFYTQMVGGKSMIDHLQKLYDKKASIEDFLREGLAFAERNIDILTK